MHTHALWYMKPHPPLLLGWAVLPLGGYASLTALMAPIMLTGDVLFGLGTLFVVYFGTGFLIVEKLMPKTIEWADLPTPMITSAKWGIIYGWPTRWASIMVAVSWTKLLD